MLQTQRGCDTKMPYVTSFSSSVRASFILLIRLLLFFYDYYFCIKPLIEKIVLLSFFHALLWLFYILKVETTAFSVLSETNLPYVNFWCLRIKHVALMCCSTWRRNQSPIQIYINRVYFCKIPNII